MRLWVALLGFVTGALLGCRRPAPAGRSLTGEPPDRVLELRLALARDPEDGSSHLALAELLERRGQPRAAIRHYEQARRHGRLAPADRRTLARLLLARGRRRLALGDPDAAGDLDAARGLDRALVVPAVERGEACFLAAAAVLRRDRRDRAARRWLECGRALRPGDPRGALLAPASAPLPDLARSVIWLLRAGARRAALDGARWYVQRGGRERSVLDGWVALEQWWGGVAVVERLRPRPRELGLSACLSTLDPDEPACVAELPLLARDADRALRLWWRAERLHWRATDPRSLESWTLVALRAWLQGEAPSLAAAVSRRVDLAALAATPEALAGAGAARATLLRAGGRLAAAHGALATALATRQESGADVARAALLWAEAALQGRGDEVVDWMEEVLAAAGPEPLAWLVAITAARAAAVLDGSSRLARQAGPFLARAAPALRDRFLRQHGELGPWLLYGAAGTAGRRPGALTHWHRATGAVPGGRRALLVRWQDWLPGAQAAFAALLAAGDAPAPAAVDAGRIAAELDLPAGAGVELADIARLYLHDPALAERRARDFVDGALLAMERAPAVAELLARLGDPGRAERFWQLAFAEHPAVPWLRYARGRAELAAGHHAAADIHFLRAAAASGDPGATSAAAAVEYLRRGAWLWALACGKRAAELSGRGLRQLPHTVLVEAMRALGRSAGADAALAELLAEVPPRFRDAARAELLTAHRGPVPPALRGPGWRGTRDALLAALHRGAPVPDWAAAYDPGDGELAAALLDRGAPSGAVSATTDLARGLRAAQAWSGGRPQLHQLFLRRVAPGPESETEAPWQAVLAEQVALGLIAPAGPAAVALRGAADRLAAASREAALLRAQARSLEWRTLEPVVDGAGAPLWRDCLVLARGRDGELVCRPP
jgi:hypothetical protein